MRQAEIGFRAFHSVRPYSVPGYVHVPMVAFSFLCPTLQTRVEGAPFNLDVPVSSWSHCDLLSAPAVSDQFMCLTFPIPFGDMWLCRDFELDRACTCGVGPRLESSSFSRSQASLRAWSQRGRCALRTGQFRCQHFLLLFDCGLF